MLWSSPGKAPEVGGKPVEKPRKTAAGKLYRESATALSRQRESFTGGAARAGPALLSRRLWKTARNFFSPAAVFSLARPVLSSSAVQPLCCVRAATGSNLFQ